MVVDQPQRVRVAAEMGMESVPGHVTIVQPDVLVQRCGPGTPAGFGNVSISGESTPPGGAVLPPGLGVTPPPTEPDPGPTDPEDPVDPPPEPPASPS